MAFRNEPPSSATTTQPSQPCPKGREGGRRPANAGKRRPANWAAPKYPPIKPCSRVHVLFWGFLAHTHTHSVTVPWCTHKKCLASRSVKTRTGCKGSSLRVVSAQRWETEKEGTPPLWQARVTRPRWSRAGRAYEFVHVHLYI